jgi:hypothetical protein
MRDIALMYPAARACAGKLQFSDRSEAKRAMRRNASTRDDHGLEPYRCFYCGFVHLGHRRQA